MAETEQVWTVGRLLQWTTDFLRQRGADSPRLDAEVLLAHSLSCPRIALYTRYDEQPSDDVRGQFRQLVRERAAGKPVAYLVGSREFYALSFRVTPDVLIPRPETEFLLIRLLDLARERLERAGSSLTVADVGTGSGILAVCAARELGNVKLTAIDISPAALAVARQNATAHGVSEKIEFVESDMFAAISPERQFDFIVSNPPYVKTSEMPTLATDVRQFEPRAALEAGPLGTEVIGRLVAAAGERLLPDGWLLAEIGPGIEADARRLIEQDSRLEVGPTLKDLAGLPRVVQARRRA